MLTGRCLCGAISYQIDGDPIVVAHCHCLDCQRLSGAGHATGAMFPDAGIRLNGEPATYSTTSEAGNTVMRLFCRRCGSPLFGKNTGMPGFMTVSLGTLDSSGGLKPQVAIFARTRRNWDVMDATLPTFDAQPEWKPTDPV
ncbi:MAG: GFA family protein [Rhodospirillaceae bacterium]|nr:GFA family protein [Rhodospirillaceae bacterium]